MLFINFGASQTDLLSLSLQRRHHHLRGDPEQIVIQDMEFSVLRLRGDAFNRRPP